MMRRRPGAFVCEGHREAIPTHNPFRLNVCRGIQTQQKEPRSPQDHGSLPVLPAREQVPLSHCETPPRATRALMHCRRRVDACRISPISHRPITENHRPHGPTLMPGRVMIGRGKRRAEFGPADDLTQNANFWALDRV
jgi:hypothetical protein